MKRLLLCLMIPGFLCADPLADNQARFGKIQGTVYLLTQGAKGWIDAHEDLPIEPGDEIHAEDESTAEIIMSDSVLVMLQPDADVVVDTLDAGGGRLHLTDGSIVGSVDAQHSSMGARQWEFDTPALSATVHGAEFGIRVGEKDVSRVGVFAGEIAAQPAEGPSGPAPAVTIGTAQEAVLQRGKPLARLARFSPVMQALAQLRPDARRRQARIESTWSPLTAAYRLELRRKFVPPVPPPSTHPHPIRRRRAHSPEDDNS